MCDNMFLHSGKDVRVRTSEEEAEGLCFLLWHYFILFARVVGSTQHIGGNVNWSHKIWNRQLWTEKESGKRSTCEYERNNKKNAGSDFIEWS